tara:strand:+ start:1624 stop:2391 length:768 start_codon:yes stop_codon:yes gene_type:complete
MGSTAQDGTGASASVDALYSPAISGITRLSAVETVRARIALSIQLGLLKPGEALPADSEVAEALEVSEITVRRALKSLADDNLLVRKRGRGGGTFVSETPSDIPLDAVAAFRADTTEVRALINKRTLLETALAHHAALSASAAQLNALDDLVLQAGNSHTWAEYHAADEKLHMAIAAASGLDWAVPLYRDALHELYRYFLPYPIEFLHHDNEEHAQLVQALRDRDPVAAVAIIERHVLILHETMFVGLDDRSTRT